jgi:hypothetical protein
MTKGFLVVAENNIVREIREFDSLKDAVAANQPFIDDEIAGKASNIRQWTVGASSRQAVGLSVGDDVSGDDTDDMSFRGFDAAQ